MGLRHLGVGEETTYGTADTRDHFFEAVTESVQREINWETIEVLRSYSALDVVELNRAVRGDVEVIANYDGIALLYKHLLGSVDTTTGAVAPYDHTIPASTGIPADDRLGLGLTLEFRRDGSLVWVYPGCKITAMTHEMNIDAAQRLSFTFLSQGTETTTGTATTASWPTTLVALPHHVNVTFGSTALTCRSATLTVENPLDEPYILGQTTMGKEPDRNGILKVTASIDAYFDNWTDFYNSFDGTTVVDVAIGSTNATEGIVYNMNKCRIAQATPHNSGRDRLTATVEVESYYDATATENLQVVVSNNDSAP